MKLILIYILSLVLFCAAAFGGDGQSGLSDFRAIDDSTIVSAYSIDVTKNLFSGRKQTALLYSIVVPGSGQTMLGSPYKGFGFTILGFGSALTTLISHNNFVASNERLDALEFQYRNSTTWESSDAIFRSLNETYTKMNNYKKMRNTFAVISVVVWTLNIADVIFFTEDEGESVFSKIRVEEIPITIADNVIDHQLRLKVVFPLN